MSERSQRIADAVIILRGNAFSSRSNSRNRRSLVGRLCCNSFASRTSWSKNFITILAILSASWVVGSR